MWQVDAAIHVPKEPRERDGIAATLLWCWIASEVLPRNMPLRPGGPGKTFWRLFRDVGPRGPRDSCICQRRPDYSSNLCPHKIWSIWLFLGGCFGAFSTRKRTGSRPKTPLKKSYRSYFRRAQFRWVIWPSSNIAVPIAKKVQNQHF